MKAHRVGRIAILSVLVLMVGWLSGCDYWPPALQSQIESLKAELNMAAAEKTRLENQVKEAVKSRDELQAKFDDMARINRELTARIATLEQGLAAERERVAKLSKPAARPKSSAKATAKKPAGKKKTSGVAAKSR